MKEVRNSWVGKWQSLLCQGKLFSLASHSHLQVGHTHEDVGRAFYHIHKLRQMEYFPSALLRSMLNGSSLHHGTCKGLAWFAFGPVRDKDFAQENGATLPKGWHEL